MLCATCREDKDPSEFYDHYYTKQDGTRSKMVNCKPCLLARNKQWVGNNPENRKNNNRKATLRRFGLTVEDYDSKFAEQSGKCAICKQPESNGRQLAVDHDHACCSGTKSCGKCIRGLLCFQCNARIWILESDLLKSAQDYLQSYSHREVNDE